MTPYVEIPEEVTESVKLQPGVDFRDEEDAPLFDLYLKAAQLASNARKSCRK